MPKIRCFLCFWNGIRRKHVKWVNHVWLLFRISRKETQAGKFEKFCASSIEPPNWAEKRLNSLSTLHSSKPLKTAFFSKFHSCFDLLMITARAQTALFENQSCMLTNWLVAFFTHLEFRDWNVAFVSIWNVESANCVDEN